MSDNLSQHYVTFYSPGTFVSEESCEKVDSWDVEAATERAQHVLERHGATPYGFRFTTRSRGPDDLDAKQTAKSPFYWLGGRVETLADVEARNDPGEHILRSNMRNNDIKRVIINDNSWRFTGTMSDDDVVLDFTPPERAEPTK